MPDVLRIDEIDRPEPAPDGVVVRVRAASVNRVDWYDVTGRPWLARPMSGLRGPKSPPVGGDFAGTVEAVGQEVTDFEPGDNVFGIARGSFADCASVRKAAALKPATVSFEEAAAVPVAGLTALQGLRDHGLLQPGQSVIVNGASGGVGTFAVQIAKSLGAEVTAVCSTRNLEVVSAIGADHVLDYTKDDFAAHGQRYDLIVASNGDRSIWDYRRALSANGTYVMTGGSNRQLTDAVLFGPLLSMGRQKLGNLLVKPNQADLLFLKELCEAGTVKPRIDRRFPLSEVPAAIR